MSCKSVRRVVETGNITVETYGSLHRVQGIVQEVENDAKWIHVQTYSTTAVE